ncbi:hypothetical protein A2Y68_01315 [Candidatus Woesebacteria bacterium RBG_13_46_13]|uniref:UVR domain-containing protein n=1 Tax=Candidatus Woesebacteria bacterium RBG_13_46_13 TaxID=1802479 RepID=A0A1F7X519_9BACT|nr:MAG: hypothetical protein A2Y68_01315 [Candidatus Woesebacteria bacterium RBG_13_46_13]
MVESPMGNREIEAYRRVEQLLMEEALEMKFPPEEARRQTQKLLEPMAPTASIQEQPLKKAA